MLKKKEIKPWTLEVQEVFKEMSTKEKKDIEIICPHCKTITEYKLIVSAFDDRIVTLECGCSLSLLDLFRLGGFKTKNKRR